MVRATPARTPRADAVLVGVAILVSAVLLAQLVDFGWGRDQGIYAAVAQAVRDGGAPYRDAWDFKPPGIFFVYAGASALLGPGIAAVRWLEALALVSMVIAFALLSRLYLGDWRAGLVGGALALLTHVQLEFWHTGQPESFGAPLVAWSLLSAGAAMRSRRAGRERALWLASGLLIGLATVLKPTIGVAGLASLALAAVRRREDEGPRAARVLVAAGLYAAGAAVPVAACWAFLQARGATGAMWDALFVFLPRYTAIGWESVPLLAVLKVAVYLWFAGFSLLYAVGLPLALLDTDSRTREGLVHVGLAVLLLLCGVVAQMKLFLYHFGTLLPLTGLLAGWGYWRLWQRARGRWLGLAAFAVLVLALGAARTATSGVSGSFWTRCALRWVAWSHPAERVPIRDHLYSLQNYLARDNRLVSEWLARGLPAGSRLLVFGFTPEIYVRSGSRPASRYIYDVPLRAGWTRSSAREELMKELASPPAAIVVERADSVPLVTGSPGDSESEVADFPGLRSLIERQYTLAFRVPKFDVFLRTR